MKNKFIPDITKLHHRISIEILRFVMEEGLCIGDRLPPERVLASVHKVSRPTVRQAIVVLESLGFLEVRHCSGAFVVRLPTSTDGSMRRMSLLELTEARLALETQVAALAASRISDTTLILLDEIALSLKTDISLDPAVAARDFFLIIASATENAAIVTVVTELWNAMELAEDITGQGTHNLRTQQWKLAKDLQVIIEALRERSPARARDSVKDHIAIILEGLLAVAKEATISGIRQAAKETRLRFASHYSS